MKIQVALASNADNLQSMRKYAKEIKKLQSQKFEIEIDLEVAMEEGDKHDAAKLRRKLKGINSRIENAEGLYRSYSDQAKRNRNKKK